MDLTSADWFKSSYSAGETNCVEVAHLGLDVGIRDSQHPDRTQLAIPHHAWTAFLAHLKHSE